MALTWPEYEQRLSEIKSLRRRGELSAKQAYEQHMGLLASANPSYRAQPLPRFEIEGGIEFKKVWYRPAERRTGQVFELAYNNVGSLYIGDEVIVFQGDQQILISNPRLVTFSRQGPDLVNNWVKLVYGDPSAPEVAFFADGRYKGWAGVLGGTRRIFDTLSLFV